VFDANGDPIRFTLNRTSDAAAEPLTTALAKSHLRVSSSDEDTLIDAYVKAARQKVETDTGRALINQTWTLSMDATPSGCAPIRLPIGPVSSVTSIKSYATDDTETTLSTDVYRLDVAGPHARVVLKDGQSWPTGLRPQNALLVTFVAGYGASASNVTDVELIQAVRLLVGHWYATREPIAIGMSAAPIDLTYQALIAPFRLEWV
jgi:uncharacterized phiE125 gp8 family phage protein